MNSVIAVKKKKCSWECSFAFPKQRFWKKHLMSCDMKTRSQRPTFMIIRDVWVYLLCMWWNVYEGNALGVIGVPLIKALGGKWDCTTIFFLSISLPFYFFVGWMGWQYLNLTAFLYVGSDAIEVSNYFLHQLNDNLHVGMWWKCPGIYN